MSIFKVVRGEEPRKTVLEQLSAGAPHVLADRADREQESLAAKYVTAQVPINTAIALGMEVSVTLENGERITGVVMYLEHVVKEAQAVSKVKLEVLPATL